MNKIIWGLVLLLLASCSQQPPQRLPNIPEAAKWYGGLDGGTWIMVTETPKDNVFYAIIYTQSKGSVWVQGDFALDSNCIGVILNKDKLEKSIVFFDGGRIMLSILNKNNRYCYLKKTVSD